MSKRERVMAALSREEPDRVPCCELNIYRAEKITIPWIFHGDGNIMVGIDILVELGMAAIQSNEKLVTDIRCIKQ